MNRDMLVPLLVPFCLFLEYVLLLLDDNVDEECQQFSDVKSSASGCCLSICLIFCQFQQALLIKVLLIRKKASSEAYCRKASLILRVSHNTSVQIKLFILPLKKIVEKQLIIAYPRGKIPLRKIKTKRTMPPENCHRQTPAPREWPPSNKATLQEIQVVFQAQYDRMNYQTSQLRRIAHCWMLLVQASNDISQPGQAYNMGILEKMVNGLKFILRLI